jgi:hypothetical protein
MTDQQKQEFLQWVTYPALFKNKLRKAVESGLLFKVLDDPTVDDTIKVSLKELMPNAVKQADPIKLMKVYNKTLSSVQKPFNAHIRNVQRDFIRIPPSKRSMPCQL